MSDSPAWGLPYNFAGLEPEHSALESSLSGLFRVFGNNLRNKNWAGDAIANPEYFPARSTMPVRAYAGSRAVADPVAVASSDAVLISGAGRPWPQGTVRISNIRQIQLWQPRQLRSDDRGLHDQRRVDALRGLRIRGRQLPVG